MPPENTGKAMAANGADIANQTVGNAAAGAACMSRGAQKLAPRRNAKIAAAGEDSDVTRLQVVDQINFLFIDVHNRIIVMDFHIETGARPATEHQRVIERADGRMCCLLMKAEGIKGVRQNGRVEFASCLVDELVVDIGGHVG